jgi:hypothetical protein
MPTAPLVEQLMSARQQLDFACHLLVKPSPQAMDCCSSVLEAAGRRLAECQPAFSQQAGNAAALQEAWRLRRTYVRTARLLQGAADFHFNWLQLRGAMTGGYTGNGESAPLMHSSRISLHG